MEKSRYYLSSGPWSESKASWPSRKPASLQGDEVTVSENHPSWNRKRSFQGDIGGPFHSRKSYAVNPRAITLNLSGRDGTTALSLQYTGYCAPSQAYTASLPPLSYSADSALNAWGIKAIQNCKPTNIFVDLSASLGELLREGSPVMDIASWKKGIDLARQAGSNYLSLEFGFKPIIADITNSAVALTRADAAIQQYVRDAGKIVRRRFDFPVQVEENYLVVGDGPSAVPATVYSGSLISDLFYPGGQVILSRKTEVRRWFSGAFTYHLPYDDSLRNLMSEAAVQARGLLSLDLTPESLWNLAPWSWAIDWFAPVGDYISNLQDWASDGLVLRYGYMMEHYKCTHEYRYSGRNSGLVSPVTLISESKKRVRANPFGFGIPWSGLSPRQLTIAAALGITRS